MRMDWMDDEMVNERPALPPDHPANQPTESMRELGAVLKYMVRKIVPGDVENDFASK